MEQTKTATTGCIQITLADGKARIIRFTMGAMKKLREEKQVDFTSGFSFLQFRTYLAPDGVDVTSDNIGSVKVDMDKLAELLHRGLVHRFEGGEKTLTMADLEEMIDILQGGAIFNAVMQAVGFALPQPKNDPPAVPGTPGEPETKPDVQ